MKGKPTCKTSQQEPPDMVRGQSTKGIQQGDGKMKLQKIYIYLQNKIMRWQNLEAMVES